MKSYIFAMAVLFALPLSADEFRAEYCGENKVRKSKVERVCLGELQGGVSSFLSGVLIELRNGKTLTYDAYDIDYWDRNEEDLLVIDDSGDQRYYLDIIVEDKKPVRVTGAAEYDQRVDVDLKPHIARKGILCKTFSGKVLLDWDVHGELKFFVPKLKKTLEVPDEESYVAQTDPSSKLLIEGYVEDDENDKHYDFEIRADLGRKQRPVVTLKEGRKGIQYTLYCKPKAK